MTRRKDLLLVIATFIVAPLAASAAPITVPTDLSVGDKYRLAFVTSTTRDSTSTNIADYNAFVFAAANSVSELAALGTTWTVIGSTETVDARDNTGTNPSSTGFPIYRLDGTRIANNNADLWDGDIQVPIRFIESGSVSPSNRVLTGTSPSGVGQSNRELGHANPVVAYGDPLESASGWILLGGLLETDVRRLYGMSGVLTVLPDPVSIVDVIYDTPVIDFGPLSFGLAELPAEPEVTFLLGDGTPAGGGATSYGLADVLSATLVFGDVIGPNDAIGPNNFTAFTMEVDAGGVTTALSYAFAIPDTATAEGSIIMNFPFTVTGTDIASGQAFSYTYANSEVTITLILAGDLDGNGFVDILDLNIVLSNWNTDGSADPRADTDGSGLVDIIDLNVVLTDWNMGTPPAGSTVPEPGTLGLVTLSGLMVLWRRR